MCFRVSGFKGSRQSPAQEAMSQCFPGCVLVADPGLRDLPPSLGKDAEEGGVGKDAGESQNLSGNHLKGNGCFCMALPSSGS